MIERRELKDVLGIKIRIKYSKKKCIIAVKKINVIYSHISNEIIKYFFTYYSWNYCLFYN